MPTDLAPPPLQRLLDFVNTRNVETGHDEIAATSQLSAWLVANSLLESPLEATSAEHGLATEIREELRAALLANHEQPDAAGRPPGGSAIDRITFTVQLDRTGTPSLVPAQAGVKGALGRLLQPLPAAAADGTWARAKVCPSDTCRWAFYDHSRNRSRRWCSMEVCGNREKSRSFRERHDA